MAHGEPRCLIGDQGCPGHNVPDASGIYSMSLSGQVRTPLFPPVYGTCLIPYTVCVRDKYSSGYNPSALGVVGSRM